MAGEEKDNKHTVNAMKQVIRNCTFDQVDVDTLPIFEVENIFLRLREKSVGEQIEFRVMCTDEECGSYTPHSLDLSTVSYDKSALPDRAIRVSEHITINMKYPTLTQAEDITNLENMEESFQFLANCIESIEADGNIYDMSTTSKEELKEFLESMTANQFVLLRNWFTSLPTVSKEVEFTCMKCNKEQKRVITGLQSFLV